MARQYSHVTVAISPEKLDEFEQLLQEIKDCYGIDSTSTVIQRLLKDWAELKWKAQKYDQLKDIILGFEAYYQYKKGELIHADRGERPDF